MGWPGEGSRGRGRSNVSLGSGVRRGRRSKEDRHRTRRSQSPAPVPSDPPLVPSRSNRSYTRFHAVRMKSWPPAFPTTSGNFRDPRFFVRPDSSPAHKLERHARVSLEPVGSSPTHRAQAAPADRSGRSAVQTKFVPRRRASPGTSPLWLPLGHATWHQASAGHSRLQCCWRQFGTKETSNFSTKQMSAKEMTAL